jgi:hypothetical protein
LAIEKETLIFRPLSGFALEQFLSRFSSKKKAVSGQEEMTWLNAAMVMFESFDAAINQPSHFAGFFRCKVCDQSVVSMGLAKKPSMKEGSGVTMIKVEGFNPPIPIIALQEFVPSPINCELMRSFSYYHSDICASGSMLRRAVEKTCLELGHKQKTLHASIDSFKREHPEEGSLLEALKLVGNEATHSDGIAEEDILDSYEVLSLVLELFRRKKMHQKAKSIAGKLSTKHNKSN